MKAIILDMYGVIIEQTGDDWAPYVQMTFPHLTQEDIYAPWLKAEAGEITSLAVWKSLGFTGDLEQVEQKYLDTLKLNRGFHDFALAASKNHKMAIISNDLSRWSRYLREKFDIDKYFNVICISGDSGMNKPDERIFRHTIEQLGCTAKDCLYVDDRVSNLIAASAIGMNVVWFSGGNIPYEGKTVTDFSQLKSLLVL